MESESIQNLSALRVGTYRACNSLFLIAVLQFHEARTRVLDYFRKVSARFARKFGLDLERLRKSDEKFIKAFRASPLPISITTRMEGRFIDVNDAFLQMLGFSREQVIGHTVTEIEFWDDPDARTRMLMELAEGKSVKTMPVKFRSRSGEYREGNLSAELIDLDGVPCVLAITQDLTETKRLEKQLRQAQKMEAMGQLVGGIAHDFNNMLSIVMGYSDLALQNQSAADPNRLNLVQIKKAAERAASFIRQLLTFSRGSAFFPRVFELNRVISGLDEMLSRMLGEDITLTFRPIGFPVYINADLGQIEQLVMNLVLNARDAMPNGGEIFVEAGIMDVKLAYVDKHAAIPPGRYVTLSVTDTGCGMDDKTLTQMFEPFFTTKPSGTGLGLATVRRL
jgi:two-component system, cell cycle sensor histidine kinase and response regulator CckA